MELTKTNVEWADGKITHNGQPVRNYHDSIGRWLYPLTYQHRDAFYATEQGKIARSQVQEARRQCDLVDSHPGYTPESLRGQSYQRMMSNVEASVAAQRYGVTAHGIADFIDRILSDGTLMLICMSKTIPYEEVTARLNLQAYMFSLANPDVEVTALKVLHLPRNGSVKLVAIRQYPSGTAPHFFAAYQKLEDPKGILDQLREEMPEGEKELALQILNHQAYRESLELKDRDLKRAILDGMVLRGQREYHNEQFRVIRTASYERPQISVADVREKYPEVFKELGKWVRVAESIKVSAVKGASDDDDCVSE